MHLVYAWSRTLSKENCAALHLPEHLAWENNVNDRYAWFFEKDGVVEHFERLFGQGTTDTTSPEEHEVLLAATVQEWFPAPLYSYMVRLCQPRPREDVCDPVMSTGDLLSSACHHVNTIHVFGCDPEASHVQAARARVSLLTGTVPSFRQLEQRTNLLYEDLGTADGVGFDVILSHIPETNPWGRLKHAECCARIKRLKMRGTKYDTLLLQWIMTSLKDGGRCAVIVPDDFLQSTADMQSHTRKYLINNFEVKRVIKCGEKNQSILWFEKSGQLTTVLEFWEWNEVEERCIGHLSREELVEGRPFVLAQKPEIPPPRPQTESVLLKDVCALTAIAAHDGERECIAMNEGSTSTKYYLVKSGDCNLRYVYYCVMLSDQKGLSSRKMLDMPIPLPSVEVQNTIANRLDALLPNPSFLLDLGKVCTRVMDVMLEDFEGNAVVGIVHAQRMVRTLKQLVADVRIQVSSLLFAASTREDVAVVPMGTVVEFRSGYAFKSTTWLSTAEEDAIPVLKTGNIKAPWTTQFDKDDFAHVKEDVRWDDYKWCPGEVAIALSGSTVGSVTMNATTQHAYLNQRVVAAKTRDASQLMSQYLFYYTGYSGEFEEDVRQLLGDKSNLSIVSLESMEFPLPDISIQEDMVRRLDLQLDHLQHLERLIQDTDNNIHFMVALAQL
jgi:hypothetical protein